MKKRFWEKVNISGNQCWEWTASLNNGYGWFNTGSKIKHAHRVAAFLSGKLDSLDSEFHVLHHCDNPKCCNPNHLFIGTNNDNIADKVNKGRCGFKRMNGQSNGMSKLKNNQIKEIKGLYFSSMFSQSQLAKKYGIQQSHVSRIVNGIRCGGVF